MTSPYSSSSTSSFNLSGNTTLDPLLSQYFEKWGGNVGTGASLSYSFPWTGSSNAYWQSNYSTENEPYASVHFGLNSIQIQAAQNALSAWANVANLHFTEVSETSANVGDFRFAFSSDVDNLGAWGWCVYPNNYWASAADVWIASKYSTDPEWSAGTYNYEALMHEIGHGLGLKHPGNYDTSGNGTPGPYLSSDLDNRCYTIMSYNDPAKSRYWDSARNTSVFVCPETPMVYDIQAIQYLYGANTDYCIGNDLYNFDANTPFCKTIWDAGGTDTIDVSNFSLGCSINLTPGSYSKISYASPAGTWFDGSNDLGIAFGAIIENAVGSSASDTLTGNTANNSLSGNDGNDTLYGGDGNDILTGGNGNDTVLYNGDLNNYRLSYNSALDTFSIIDLSPLLDGNDGIDTVSGVEYFQFKNNILKSRLELTALAGATTSAPILVDLPTSSQAIFVGTAADLADFTVVDFDSTYLTVTLTANNGTINGLTDADSTKTGIQLSGMSAVINSAIAGATFTALSAGSASIDISATDGTNTPVTGTYNLNATTYHSNVKIGTDNNDSLNGSYTDDTLIGGAGNDSLYGGKGTDTAQYTGAYSNFTITPIYSGKNSELSGFNIKDNVGIEGSDTIDLDFEYLSFSNGTSTYKLVSPSSSSASSLTGTSANDYLVGNNQSNIVNGSDGDDLLMGGTDNDTLYGGKGTDTAIYAGAYSNFTIMPIYSSKTLSGYSVKDNTATEGTDTVSTDVEYLAFKNGQSLYKLNNGTVTAVNNTPTGSVTISGTIKQNETITAVNTLTDADGLGTIAYQWQLSTDAQSWTSLSNNVSITLAEAQVGKYLRVSASYTDGKGNLETVLSSTSSAVININDAPTGSVVINGAAKSGQVLAASNTIADADGLGPISYKWQSSSNGSAWSDLLTGPSLTLNDTHVGKSIRTIASYTDGHGTAESVASAASSSVLGVIDTKTLNGTDGNDNLVGTAGNDLISAGSGNDVITGSAGNDTIDGGAGLDTVSYSLDYSQFSISKGIDGAILLNSSSLGADSISNVERIKFKDKWFANDLSGSAGDIAKIIVTAFGSQSINQFMSAGLALADSGKTLTDICKIINDAKLIETITEDNSTKGYVSTLFTNVVGRAPNQLESLSFVNMIDSGTISRQGLLELAVNTTLVNDTVNSLQIDLLGIPYTPGL